MDDMGGLQNDLPKYNSFEFYKKKTTMLIQLIDLFMCLYINHTTEITELYLCGKLDHVAYQ